MATGILSQAGVRRLERDLAALMAAGRAEAESAVGHVLAVTYHRVGTRILKERLSERAGYGEAVLANVAEALAVDVRTLQHAVQFARRYAQAPEPGLSWSHYRQLIQVGDDRARRWYEARALTQGWTKRKLVEAIRGEQYEQGRAGDKGRKVGPQLSRPTQATHVYRMEVERVVDGDTLLVHVDLGFEVIKVQRLRLSDVDVAPLSTAQGKEAHGFIVERLARSPVVVVKTVKTDLHGRYVGHVMYAHREMDAAEVFAQGRYLNQELLDAGLATAN